MLVTQESIKIGSVKAEAMGKLPSSISGWEESLQEYQIRRCKCMVTRALAPLLCFSGIMHSKLERCCW